MKLLLKGFSTLCLLWLISMQYSCNKEAKEPSYIQIDTFLLSTDYSTQGSASHGINTAWIYVNDNPIGVFELPCKVPVTSLGEVNVSVFPGIKANGISSTRVQYPNFKAYTTTAILKADSTCLINPSTTYFSSTEFPYREAFENPGVMLEPTSISEEGLQIVKTTNASEVFEGSSSGKVVIDASHSFIEFATTQAYSLPSSSSVPVFLELNYKSNHNIRLGIYAEGQTAEVQEEIGGLNPTDSWKKVYIYLTPKLQNYSGADFRIYFGILRDSSSPEVITAYFDNLKIVHP
ncbi:MAG: hypothetical protein K1X82_12980 [Bacteroidia bacterium]|nr:hypothetical protein [Bacteroidia bacterium]